MSANDTSHCIVTTERRRKEQLKRWVFRHLSNSVGKVKTWRDVVVRSRHVKARSLKLSPTVEWSSTWATCEMYAVTDFQSPVSTIRSHFHDHGQCWRCNSCTPCTRILRRCTLRSFRCICCRSTGRCLGRTWWTSFRCGSQVHRSRCYPSSQTREACSCLTLQEQWTCCIRPSTSCRYVAAAQISACKDRWVSVDWVCRFQSSSCLSSR